MLNTTNKKKKNLCQQQQEEIIKKERNECVLVSVAFTLEHVHARTRGSGGVLLRFPQQLQENVHLGYFHLGALWQVLTLLDLHIQRHNQ